MRSQGFPPSSSFVSHPADGCEELSVCVCVCWTLTEQIHNREVERGRLSGLNLITHQGTNGETRERGSVN